MSYAPSIAKYHRIPSLLLLTLVADTVTDLWHKVIFLGAVGAFTALSTYLSLTNWSKFPSRFVWTNTFDKLVGFGLAGLALHFLGPGASVWS